MYHIMQCCLGHIGGIRKFHTAFVCLWSSLSWAISGWEIGFPDLRGSRNFSQGGPDYNFFYFSLNIFIAYRGGPLYIAKVTTELPGQVPGRYFPVGVGGSICLFLRKPIQHVSQWIFRIPVPPGSVHARHLAGGMRKQTTYCIWLMI